MRPAAGYTLLLLAACRANDFDAVAGAPAARAAHVDSAAGGWPANGGDVANTRYTALRDITPENVHRLRIVRVHEIGASWRERFVGWRSGRLVWYRPGTWTVNPRAWRSERQVSTPLVDRGVLFYTGAYGLVAALDARSGEELWRYQHHMRAAPMLCCGPSNRGVAVDSSHVYLATLDAQLVALDRQTGALRWQVRLGEPKDGYSATMAPLVADGKVIVGVSGADFGIRGFVDAYEPATGRRAWRFWTIPSPREGGWWGRWTSTTPDGDRLPRDTARERADSARYPDSWQHGGGSVWMTPAFDPRLGLVYIGVGNPAPALNGTIRPGDNLFTVSIVALDVRTGTRRWHYQMVPHDLWDTDASTPPVLFDLPGSGGAVPALAEAGKNGWVYILDRRTGARIVRSEPFVPQFKVFGAPDTAWSVHYPAVLGGARAILPAYSPATELIYVLGAHVPTEVRRRDGANTPGLDYYGGSDSPAEPSPSHPPAAGSVSAISARSGKIVWRVPMSRPPSSSGLLVTATGVLFYGDGPRVRAVDAATGRPLWSLDVGSDVNGAPIAFTAGGRQRVAVVSQRGLLVLALDSR